jgi:hypothetical protein
MISARVGLFRAAVLVAAGWAAAACTTTETKTVEVPTFVRFNAPPDSNYLGYFDDTSHTVTCGNCHAGQQADWSGTAHASAWNDLVGAGVPPNVQATCEPCHTVNGSHGNRPVGSPSATWTNAKWGWDSVKSVRYHDVQCESCHGPGHYQQANGDNSQAHVVNPTIVANRPLASMHIDTAAAALKVSCGLCHSDAGVAKHHNYLKEWKASQHGNIRTSPAYITTDLSRGCPKCHEGKAALEVNLGVITNYREKGATGAAAAEAVNCVVCHDPHGTAKDATGAPLPGQLRFPLDAQDLSVNLCTHCHNRNTEQTDSLSTTSPSVAAGQSPHGAQGAVLFGTAGYFPPGTVYENTAILASHGSTANPRLCAGCHVNVLNGKDSQNNSIKFTGHTFHPLPCMEAGGKPDSLVDTTFTNDCAYDEPSRSYLGCVGGACHGSEAVALSRLTGAVTEFKGYLDVIYFDKNANGRIDPYPSDTGYLAKLMADTVTKTFAPWIPAGYVCDHLDSLRHCGSGYWQLNDSVNTSKKVVITSAKGARFNVRLTGDRLTAYGTSVMADPETAPRENVLGGHPDGSHGVHNPFLYRALLQSSMADLLAHYGGAGGLLPAPPAPVLSKLQAAVQNGQLRLSPMLTQAIFNPQVISRR